MEVNRCDCSIQGFFTLFCISEGCHQSRRLCGTCKKLHQQHKIIQYDDFQTYDVYSINSESQNMNQLRGVLNKVIQITKFTKEKILLDIKAMSHEVNQIFHKKILAPLQTLLNTTTNQQKGRKYIMTAVKETTKEKLSLIAQELRALSKPCFNNNKWINNMSQQISLQLAQSRESIQQHLQQVRNEIKDLELLSPFDEQFDENIIYLKNQRTKIKKTYQLKPAKAISEKTIGQKEQNKRDIFLSSFEKNVIGQYGSCISIEQWKQNKKLEEVEQLSLVSNNLEVIPEQLRLFPYLKKLSLNKFVMKGTKKINQIKNLDNLTQLTNLRLAYNNINEIKGLDNLVNLQTLILKDNSITVITGLEKLFNLQTLDLNENKIKKVQNLGHLSKLSYLDLRNNPLERTQTACKLLKNMKQKNLTNLFLPNRWNI